MKQKSLSRFSNQAPAKPKPAAKWRQASGSCYSSTLSKSLTISSLTFLISGGTGLYADSSCRRNNRKETSTCDDWDVFMWSVCWKEWCYHYSLAPRLQLDLDLMESGILPQFGPWMIYSPFKETDRVNFRGADSANLKASKSILAALKWKKNHQAQQFYN